MRLSIITILNTGMYSILVYTTVREEEERREKKKKVK